MESRWMTHKGKNVFWAAFDHKSLEQVRAEIMGVQEEMKKQPLKSVLFFSDTRGIIITPQVLHLLQTEGKVSNPYLKKMAMMGITGETRRKMFEMALNFVGASCPVRLFEDETQALDWLVGAV